jgi:hypothetical protein
MKPRRFICRGCYLDQHLLILKKENAMYKINNNKHKKGVSHEN